MLAYLIRRVLWMIPTFLVILIINFGVLRLQRPPLSYEMSGGQSQEDAGSRDAEKSQSNLKNYLGRMKRTGKDLPALINTRGFYDKEELVAEIRSIQARKELRESKRFERELELMLSGHLLVQPLVAILEDDALKPLHGPASHIFMMCAHTALNPEDVDVYSAKELRSIQGRNSEIKNMAISFSNEMDQGFKIDDDHYTEKREHILTWYQQYADVYKRDGRKWTALFGETGFTVFMTKLFTGTLWSETKKRYVFDVIAERWQVTLWLNVFSIILAWGIAVPLGIRSARRKGTLEDKVTTNTLFFLWSLPSFFIGSLLLYHFCTDTAAGPARFPHRGLSSPDSLWMGTPAYVMDLIWHGLLPLLVLTYASFTVLSRYMRSNLLEQLNADYVRTARAKGATEDQIVYRHSMRNSMVTMVTLGAGLLSELFGGFIIVETIFTIDGLGLLLLNAVLQQDAPLVMGSAVISVSLLMVGFLIADIMYAIVDPRIRNQYA